MDGNFVFTVQNLQEAHIKIYYFQDISKSMIELTNILLPRKDWTHTNYVPLCTVAYLVQDAFLKVYASLTNHPNATRDHALYAGRLCLALPLALVFAYRSTITSLLFTSFNQIKVAFERNQPS